MYEFLNLHDAYNSKRVPVRYVDDNSNAIVPLSVLRLAGNPAYKIEFNRNIIEFVKHLTKTKIYASTY